MHTTVNGQPNQEPAHLQRVLARLAGVVKNGDGYRAVCPAHSDHGPSLSVAIGKTGHVVMRCHGGCDTAAVLAAIRLTFAHLRADFCAQASDTYGAGSNGAATPGIAHKSSLSLLYVSDACAQPPELMRLAPPADRVCPSARRGKKNVLQRLASPGDLRLQCLPCRRWTCCACWQVIRWQRALHFAERLAKVKGSLWVRAVPLADWRAVSVGLARDKANFIKVEQGDDYLVIATGDFKGAVEKSADGAVVQLAVALANLRQRPSGKKGSSPVMSSRKWKPVKRPKRPAEWERVSYTRSCGPEPVLAVLADHGISGQVATRNGTDWCVTWLWPGNFTKAQKDVVLSQLELLPGVPLRELVDSFAGDDLTAVH